MLRALGSASCDITHETGGTICYVHCVLRLVISYTRQEVRLVMGIGFRKGHDLFEALGSASCDITHETGGTICYGHWVQTGSTICYRHCILRLVISHTRQGVRFVTGIGLCVL